MSEPDADSDSRATFLEALEQGYQAQTRMDVARQLDAEGEDANVLTEHIRFQQVVIGLFKRLRPYLVNELDRYWDEALLYEDDDGTIRGLKQLHHYEGAINERTGFSGDERYREAEAVTMPPTALRNALDHMSNALYELGMLPESVRLRKAGNVSVSTQDERPAEPGTAHETDE